MTTYKLTKEPVFNPYIINGKPVASITFYDDGGEIVTIARGWIGDSNHLHCEEMHALEFTRRLKVNYKLKEHFYVKAKKQAYGFEDAVNIYVYVPKSDLTVEAVGEHLYRKTEDERVYSHFFEISGTFDPQYSWSKPEHKTLRFSYGGQRSELTNRGKMLKGLAELMGGGYDAERKAGDIIKNQKQVMTILEGLNK